MSDKSKLKRTGAFIIDKTYVKTPGFYSGFTNCLPGLDAPTIGSMATLNPARYEKAAGGEPSNRNPARYNS